MLESSSSTNQVTAQKLEKLQTQLVELKKQLAGKNSSIQEVEEIVKNHRQDHKDRIDSSLQRLQEMVVERDQLIHQLIEINLSLVHDFNFLQRYTQSLRGSVSNKLGFALTAPVRGIYQIFNPSTEKDAIHTLLNKQIVPHAIETLDDSTHLTSLVSTQWLTTPNQESIVSLPTRIELDTVRGRVKARRRSVLFIVPHLPDYDTSSGGKRALRMLELMAEEFDVYVYTLGDRQEAYKAKLASVGVVVLDSPHLSDINIDTYQYSQLQAQLPHVDAIIYAWYTTYFQSKFIRRLYPKATVIFDSVDVHWIRETRLLGIDESLSPEGVAQNKENEVFAYKQGKIIWAVTEEDKRNILEEIPSADVRVVSNIHDIEVSEYHERKDHKILFFGGYKHTPNLSAAKKLCLEILPKIREKVPSAVVVLAGSHAPQEIIDLGNLDGVDYRGFIEDDQLDQLYEECAITIAPLLAGAGIKGKICEAISHALPVVTNSIGNEGIDLEHEIDGFITDDYDEMAEVAARVLLSDYDLSKVVSGAQTKLAKIVGPTEVKRQMVDSIEPLVSICIVTWNRLELVKRCIESVLNNTRYGNFKILVYSNGCTDGTQEYLKILAQETPELDPILSDRNEVFVIPNNKMMMRYPQGDVVLLNNDTYVIEGWLEELQKVAYCRKNTGISGSKILYPDGSLQEFGSELYANYSGNNIGKHGDPKNSAFQQIKEVGYVSGCSMYITRHTIDQIGVFDLQFHPCYCEDSDYAYTAWEQGVETVVTPYSMIYHDEGGTSGTSTEHGFKAFQDVNFHKFYLKHRGKINRINWGLDEITINRISKEVLTQFRSPLGRLIINGTQKDFSYSTSYIENRIDSFRSYKRYEHEMTPVYNKRFIIEKNLIKDQNNNVELIGFNPILNDYTPYVISDRRDYMIRGVTLPNFREELYCSKTRTNGRIRALYLKIQQLISVAEDKPTIAYNSLNNGLKDAISALDCPSIFYEWSSDHLEDLDDFTVEEGTLAPGSIDLSIETEQLHLVSDYVRSLELHYSLLRSGGNLVISVPFLINAKMTMIKAARDKTTGELSYTGKPIYFKHSSKRIDRPCFQLFGWDLLEVMRSIGFVNPHVSFTWSLYYGILGMDNMIISATKP